METLELASPETARDVLRQIAATLAYRAAKVLRDVPAGFATMTVAASARKPVQIVAHMADLMAWGRTIARGEYAWKADGSEDWDVEVRRFFDGLAALDREMTAAPPSAASVAQLIQGPFADALTHVGQLAMLRGIHGAPVRPESYARAEIVPGRLGLEQAAPVREFDGDASRRPRG
jgi:hypothetical protein